MSEVLLTFNHPVLVAERIATIDILSRGRVELCTARSNNPDTLEFFSIDAAHTKRMWRESFEIIVRAMTDAPFEFHGEFWDLPPRTMQPLPVQDPHPPLFVAATSPATHVEAGQRGIGVVSGNTVLGWDYLERNLAAYRNAVASPASPLGKVITDAACVFSATACCASTAEEAQEIAGPVARKFMDVVMAYNTVLAEKSSDYAYIGGIAALRMHDLDYLMDHNPYFQIGTPDFLIERFRRIEAMGADELVLRIDGFGHAQNMRSIEMFAKHVFPAFDRA
jgi:alkanesulfonate monooxygenase SsuD/methylene tetrahydromethanopterin reductase-like flavin-dependent oxidoreductase (luciferase family)